MNNARYTKCTRSQLRSGNWLRTVPWQQDAVSSLITAVLRSTQPWWPKLCFLPTWKLTMSLGLRSEPGWSLSQGPLQATQQICCAWSWSWDECAMLLSYTSWISLKSHVRRPLQLGFQFFDHDITREFCKFEQHEPCSWYV